MTQPTIDSEVRKFLDKFKEDTEDLWEQFMEGEDPDPQRYDDFLDNAYKDATQAITNLIAQEANKARLEQTIHLQVAEQKFGKVDWQAAIYELEPREKMT